MRSLSLFEQEEYHSGKTVDVTVKVTVTQETVILPTGIRKRYKAREKGKIAYYKSILEEGCVVIKIYSRTDSKGNKYSSLGKLWENMFGGGVSETHILNDCLDFSGNFIVTKEYYDELVKNSTKIK